MRSARRSSALRTIWPSVAPRRPDRCHNSAVVGCSEVDVLAFEFAAFVASGEFAESGGQLPDPGQVEVSRGYDIGGFCACLEETLGGGGPVERQMSPSYEVDGVVVQASG